MKHQINHKQTQKEARYSGQGSVLDDLEVSAGGLPDYFVQSLHKPRPFLSIGQLEEIRAQHGFCIHLSPAPMAFPRPTGQHRLIKLACHTHGNMRYAWMQTKSRILTGEV